LGAFIWKFEKINIKYSFGASEIKHKEDCCEVVMGPDLSLIIMG
jgi:hypothetical protein